MVTLSSSYTGTSSPAWDLNGSGQMAVGTWWAVAPSHWATAEKAIDTEDLSRWVEWGTEDVLLESGEPLLGGYHRVFISWEAGLVACGEQYGICGRCG